MIGLSRSSPRALQSALAVIYPNQCAMCDELVEARDTLCGTCWRDTPFIIGQVCDRCGLPLPGETDGPAICDECVVTGRPWESGRSALVYSARARHMVLALKHGDRLDLVRPASGWMARAVVPIASPASLFVPVPAHWTRVVKRRYNQASLLSDAVAKRLGCDHAPRALVRVERTPTQEGRSAAERFRNVENAIAPHPRLGAALAGRDVVLVDDVLTSGATLAAATEACHAAGAGRVDVLTLARVVKDA